ncbi:hypothetical protein CO046_04440 [Candidatus Peregrinibacteria bacterium CG_4_9_14_0_2_um_filter_53_11]|nr:MAG: hypothetical protein CO046_04440 [Candidatus Peregrinibacteria bacterium CG_4_9_14_0_2_um_filter_53_11]
MIYRERSINTTLIASLLGMAALILFFAHTRPAHQALSGLAEKVSVLEGEIQTIQEHNTGTNPNGLSEIDEKELDEAIPQTIEQESLVNDINKIARTTDVSFNALSFTIQRNAVLPTVSISASFQGTYQSLSRFIRELEVNPRKIVISNASVSRATSEGGLELVNLTLSMESYFRES